MDQILSHGKVVRGYLGVHIQDLTPELAKAFNLNQSGGVLIGDVTQRHTGIARGLEERRCGGEAQRTGSERRQRSCGCTFRRWRRERP